MARHKVEICGVNTANIQVISNSDMIELFNKFQNGDKRTPGLLLPGWSDRGQIFPRSAVPAIIPTARLSSALSHKKTVPVDSS